MENFDDAINKLEELINDHYNEVGDSDVFHDLDERFIEFKYAFYTDYRQHDDDEQVVAQYKDIMGQYYASVRYHDMPINMKLHYDVERKTIHTSTKIEIDDDMVHVKSSFQNVMNRIVDGMKKIHNVNGEAQQHGAWRYPKENIHDLESIVGTNKRQRVSLTEHDVVQPSNFFLIHGYIVLEPSNSLYKTLDGNKIEYNMRGDHVAVSSIHYYRLFDAGVLGKPVSNNINSKHIELFQYGNHIVAISNHKQIQRLKRRLHNHLLSKYYHNDDIDLFIVDDTMGIDISGSRLTLPSIYIPLFDHLYPKIPTTSVLPMSNIDNWYEFRGGVKYFEPWARAMKRKGCFVHNGRGATGVIYYIPVSRPSRRMEELNKSDKLETITNNIIVDKQLFKAISHAISINSVYYAVISLEFTTNVRHANAIIIDPVSRVVIRMEPHGATTRSYNMGNCDKRIQELIQMHPDLASYKYIPPSYYQKAQGPQPRERQQTIFKTVTKMFGSEERRIEVGGFCLAWTMLFEYYLIVNGCKNYDDVYINGMEKIPNELAHDIRKMQAWAVALAKEHLGDKYQSPIK